MVDLFLFICVFFPFWHCICINALFTQRTKGIFLSFLQNNPSRYFHNKDQKHQKSTSCAHANTHIHTNTHSTVIVQRTPYPHIAKHICPHNLAVSLFSAAIPSPPTHSCTNILLTLFLLSKKSHKAKLFLENKPWKQVVTRSHKQVWHQLDWKSHLKQRLLQCKIFMMRIFNFINYSIVSDGVIPGLRLDQKSSKQYGSWKTVLIAIVAQCYGVGLRRKVIAAGVLMVFVVLEKMQGHSWLSLINFEGWYNLIIVSFQQI